MIENILTHHMIPKKISECGMGVVHKAQDAKSCRYISIKFLPKKSDAGTEAFDRFVRETCNREEIGDKILQRFFTHGKGVPVPD